MMRIYNVMPCRYLIAKTFAKHLGLKEYFIASSSTSRHQLALILKKAKYIQRSHRQSQ